MLNTLTRLVKGFGKTIDPQPNMLYKSGAFYSPQPIESSMAKVYMNSFESGDQSLSAIQVSSYLHYFATQNLRPVLHHQEILDNKRQIDAQAFPIRWLQYIVNPEYRNAGVLPLYLSTRQQHVNKCVEALNLYLQIQPIDEIPVGTASNYVYASARLNINLGEVLDKYLAPLVIKKAKYLHSDGIAELTWGLVQHKYNNEAVWKAVLPLAKGRKFSNEFTLVEPLVVNASRYMKVEDQEATNYRELFNEALSKISVQDAGLKKLIEELKSNS